MSGHLIGSHVGIGLEKLDRIMDEIFNWVRTELWTGSRGFVVHYDPLKIAQEALTAIVLLMELPKKFKGLKSTNMTCQRIP